MKYYEMLVSYKHPKKTKLEYKTFIHDDKDKIEKQAPTEISGGKLLYGIHYIKELNK